MSRASPQNLPQSGVEEPTTLVHVLDDTTEGRKGKKTRGVTHDPSEETDEAMTTDTLTGGEVTTALDLV